MSDSSTASATGGSSIEAAAQAFDQILSGNDQDTEDTKEAQQTDEREDEDEEQVEETSDESEDDEQEGRESDEESEEGDEEDDQSEDDEESDEEGEEPVYTVKVDGKEVDVPLSELVKGYSRTADYTRKTQEVAAIRKAVEAEALQSRELRETYAQRLAAVEQLLQQSQPAEPNWEQLRATDPIEFAAQWADFQRRQQAQAQVQAERQYLEQQRAQEEAAQLQATLEQGRNYLLQLIPEWKNAEVAKAERAKLKDTGRKAGFSDEELSQVTDPRAVILLRKAMMYDAMVEKRGNIKPTPKKTTTPTLKPGTPATVKSKKTSELTRAKQRLAKTGDVRSAAEVFKFLI